MKVVVENSLDCEFDWQVIWGLQFKTPECNNGCLDVVKSEKHGFGGLDVEYMGTG